MAATKSKYILTALAALLIVVLLFVVAKQTVGIEQFTSPVACPTHATQGPDGRIHAGDQVFQTMTSYVAHLAELYAKGATCKPPVVTNARRGAVDVLDMNVPEESTSAKTPIRKLDDYEYTRVFESESQTRTSGPPAESLTARILDWANLPYNSEAREQAEGEFVAGLVESGFREPKSGVFFNALDGVNVQPPDEEAERQREQKILAAYRPTEVGKHIIDNDTEAVAKLVNEMYASDPNWEPVVTKIDETNYAVTELRPKPRKETYADERTISLATAEQSGLVIPPPSLDITDRLRNDPYFTKDGVADRSNDRFWKYDDFRKWTPGLERMFAPTSDTREWH